MKRKKTQQKTKTKQTEKKINEVYFVFDRPLQFIVKSCSVVYIWLNSTHAQYCHLTITTRIYFVCPLLLKLLNYTEIWITVVPITGNLEKNVKDSSVKVKCCDHGNCLLDKLQGNDVFSYKLIRCCICLFFSREVKEVALVFTSWPMWTMLSEFWKKTM